MEEISIVETTEVEQFLSAINSGSVQCSVVSDSELFFLAGHPSPLYYNFDTHETKEFSRISSAPSTCIDVAKSGELIAVGHSDGSVSFWSKTGKFSLLAKHQKLHNDPIVDIKFDNNGNVLYVGDESGLVTGLCVREALGFVNIKEVPVYQSNDKISNLIISQSNENDFQVGFIVFDNYYILFNPNLEGNFNFKESNKFEEKIKLELYPYDKLYSLTIIHGSKIEIKQITKNCNTLSILEETDTGCGDIILLIHLSKSLIFYFTTDGYACLINSYGKILLQNNTQKLHEFGIQNLHLYNNKIIFTSNIVGIISFLPWDQMIKKIADDGNYIQSLNYLAEIYLGLNDCFLSIPSNLSIRNKKILILAKQIYNEFFIKVINNKDTIFENIENIIYSVISMRLCKFFIKDIYQIFEDNSCSDIFFESLFKSTGKDFIKFCYDEFFDKFIDYYKQQNKIEEVENILLGYNYPRNVSSRIFPIVIKHDLFRLIFLLCPKEASNYILLCQIYFEKGKLLNFIQEIFNNVKQDIVSFEKKAIFIWLMIPDNKGIFQRLKYFFSKDSTFCFEFLKEIKEYLPIKFSEKDKLTIENVFEAILQILEDESYDIAKPYLDLFLPIFSNLKYSNIQIYSIQHLCTWIFTSNTPTSIRESVLKILIQKYPNIFSKNCLIQLCEKEGFIDFILDYYLPQKSYDKIISAMLTYEGYRATIFDFIEERINIAFEQIFIGIFANVSILLLLNPEKLVSIIQKYYSTSHFKIVEILPPPQKLIYLNTLLETIGQSDIDPKWLILIFQLQIQYSPSNAYTFLSKHIDEIDIDEAEKISIKANRIDCEVQIKIFKHKYFEAVSKIGKQIEDVLLELIESPTRIPITSIDELTNIDELTKPIEVITSSIELLKCITTEQSNSWQNVFLKFQFPLYHAMEKSKIETHIEEKSSIFNTITLIFCYFVISSLNYISIQHLLTILSIHFCVCIKPKDYLYILQTIINRMNYQKDICNSLDELLIYDTIKLIKKYYQEKSKGILVTTNRCCVCNEIITKSSSSITIFSCGHFCHNSPCLIDSNKCPICSKLATQEQHTYEQKYSQTISTRKVQQLIRRMDHSLKQNFNNTSQREKATNMLYFKKRDNNRSTGKNKSCLLLSLDEQIEQVNIQFSSE